MRAVSTKLFPLLHVMYFTRAFLTIIAHYALTPQNGLTKHQYNTDIHTLPCCTTTIKILNQAHPLPTSTSHHQTIEYDSSGR